MAADGLLQFVPADLYAILKCTEKLERAYVRDGVSAKDYEAQCEKLIAQFRMLWGSMKETVSGSSSSSSTCIQHTKLEASVAFECSRTAARSLSSTSASNDNVSGCQNTNGEIMRQPVLCSAVCWLFMHSCRARLCTLL